MPALRNLERSTLLFLKIRGVSFFLCDPVGIKYPLPCHGLSTKSFFSLRTGSLLPFFMEKIFVIRLGFEPKTHSLEGCCSIQLSYRTILSCFGMGQNPHKTPCTDRVYAFCDCKGRKFILFPQISFPQISLPPHFFLYSYAAVPISNRYSGAKSAPFSHSMVLNLIEKFLK